MSGRIAAVQRCKTLDELIALVWNRRNSEDRPTDEELNAWRQRRSELMHGGKP